MSLSRPESHTNASRRGIADGVRVVFEGGADHADSGECGTVQGDAYAGAPDTGPLSVNRQAKPGRSLAYVLWDDGSEAEVQTDLLQLQAA